jgi:hypothetical protein
MKTASAIILLILIPVGWIVAASAIFCWGTDKMSLYRLPYMQWLQAAPYWLLNPWMTLWICVSAVIPTLVTALILLTIVQSMRSRRRQSKVYGEQTWARPDQMRQNGLNLRKKVL